MKQSANHGRVAQKALWNARSTYFMGRSTSSVRMSQTHSVTTAARRPRRRRSRQARIHRRRNSLGAHHARRRLSPRRHPCSRHLRLSCACGQAMRRHRRSGMRSATTPAATTLVKRKVPPTSRRPAPTRSAPGPPRPTRTASGCFCPLPSLSSRPGMHYAVTIAPVIAYAALVLLRTSEPQPQSLATRSTLPRAAEPRVPSPEPGPSQSWLIRQSHLPPRPTPCPCLTLHA